MRIMIRAIYETIHRFAVSVGEFLFELRQSRTVPYDIVFDISFEFVNLCSSTFEKRMEDDFLKSNFQFDQFNARSDYILRGSSSSHIYHTKTELCDQH